MALNVRCERTARASRVICAVPQVGGSRYNTGRWVARATRNCCLAASASTGELHGDWTAQGTVDGRLRPGDHDPVRATRVPGRHDGRWARSGDPITPLHGGCAPPGLTLGVVSRGSTIVKPNARKVRTLADGRVLCGFAGATADALTLLERLESQLEQHSGQLLRASVEVAKAWRTDKYLRRLEALIVVADKDVSLTISGVGDVLEPHDGWCRRTCGNAPG